MSVFLCFIIILVFMIKSVIIVKSIFLMGGGRNKELRFFPYVYAIRSAPFDEKIFIFPWNGNVIGNFVN